MTTTTTLVPTDRNLLGQLRALTPNRPLQLHEALRIAELQANRLLRATGSYDSPTPTGVVTDLPRICIQYHDQPTSGLSYWNNHAWVICLNRAEPFTRQRFTLCHELKHILDHGRPGIAGDRPTEYDDSPMTRAVADYFAACLLMPKRLVKRRFGEGPRQTSQLAREFLVSESAMQRRLDELGLTEPRRRCLGPKVTTRSALTTQPPLDISMNILAEGASI